MTAYADHDDVAALAPKLNISATTIPSEDIVDDFCEQVSAEIRGVLTASGFSVTTTDLDALNYLRLTCSYGTLALVERAMMPGGKEPGPWKQWWDMYQVNLETIRKREVYGLVAGTSATSALPRSRYTSSPLDSDTYVDEGAFKVEEVQW